MKKADCLQCKDLPEGEVIEGHDHRPHVAIAFEIAQHLAEEGFEKASGEVLKKFT